MNDHRNELVQRIRKDYYRYQFYNLDEAGTMNFFNSKKPDKTFLSTTFNDHFIHWQMLIDCLIHMPSSSNDKNELIALCKQQYKNNSDELNIIEEFEREYVPERSLWWYTRHSFLYRIMNKAIQVQNIDLLLLFRFFIHDVNGQLMKQKSSSNICAYRAQLISKDDLELLKKFLGEFISMTSFLLASPDYEQTRSFLLSSPSSDNMEKVLFEIHANFSPDNDKPFSNTNSYSYFRNKEEVLFTIGSIFQFVGINRDSNDIWYVQLNLCTNHNHPLQLLIQEKKNDLNIVDTDLLSFGFILENMGKIDEAEKYYQTMLNHLSKDHEDIDRCYHALGEITQKKGDYDASLNWYNKSIEIDRKLSNENDLNIANSYNSIAVVYSRKGDYTLALESFKKALDIWTKILGEDHLDIAMCYNNIGIIYQEQQQYTDALEFYHKAWNIRQKHLSMEHPSLGQSHACIGNVHYRIGNYDLALEHYTLSLETFEKSFLFNHPDVAIVLRNMGLICHTKNDFQQALAYLEKSASVYRQLFSSTYPNVIHIEKLIRYISSKL